MRVDTRQLLRLPAVTEDGRRVGHVVGLVLNTETHAVERYRVCPDQCLRNWMHQRSVAELLVAPSQVVAIRVDALVVDAGMLDERTALAAGTRQAIAKVPAVAPSAAPTSANAS